MRKWKKGQWITVGVVVVCLLLGVGNVVTSLFKKPSPSPLPLRASTRGSSWGSTSLSGLRLTEMALGQILESRAIPEEDDVFYHGGRGIIVLQQVNDGLLIHGGHGVNLPIAFITFPDYRHTRYVDETPLEPGYYCYSGPYTYQTVQGAGKTVHSFRRLDEQLDEEITAKIKEQREAREALRRAEEERKAALQRAADEKAATEKREEEERLAAEKEKADAERREHEAKLAAEQAKADAERREREARREAEEREWQRAEQEKREQEKRQRLLAAQPDILAFAEQSFTAVNHTPNHVLGKAARNAGWSLQPVGPGWSEIADFYRAKNWIGLVKFLGEDTPFGLLPDKEDISKAVHTLTQRERNVLLRGDPDKIEKDLGYLLLADSETPYYDNACGYCIHTRHPDGIILSCRNPQSGVHLCSIWTEFRGINSVHPGYSAYKKNIRDFADMKARLELNGKNDELLKTAKEELIAKQVKVFKELF